jgi:hypothetical protein
MINAFAISTYKALACGIKVEDTRTLSSCAEQGANEKSEESACACHRIDWAGGDCMVLAVRQQPARKTWLLMAGRIES